MTNEERAALVALADRVAAAKSPDRDLDADIAEQALGWRYATLGRDFNGDNACQILTPYGRLYGNGFTYPPKGKLHRAYHVPQFTRDPLEALRFMGLRPDGDCARGILAQALRSRALAGEVGE
ncbi:hypothetical protein PQ455_01665 [Sphingomonas naphthae]|uniref:DUF1801 domain-containing protein n=1 Tax=Sphingomonas naphthae TaxID=1813468 RepID=A0ABY7TL50_9SPHN|nr:hypothetical protein [Sphingomonas naphthae]WCT73968.1 hypothetical protein PQ455_01665 [Sphingomonas naphthae]